MAQLIVRADGRVLEHRGRTAAERRVPPLEAIDEFIAATPPGDVPWTVGFLSYALAPLVEPRMRVRRAARPSASLPLAYLARYDALLSGHPESAATVPADADPLLAWRVHAANEAAAERLVAGLERAGQEGERALARPGTLVEHPDRARHEEAVRRALDAIAAGEVYQVNLASRFRVASALPPHRAYLRLRELQPVPHGAFLDAGGFAVLLNSPERFLRVAGDLVETHPIKGTRPRGRTVAEDEAWVRDLVTDAKERAEHVMIVDLERNDLGRICRPGTVEVAPFLAVETYATLHHLVSAVRGRLRPHVGVSELLRATFPGGSITGAPKIRATAVIAELEAAPRELYTGAFLRCSGPRALDSAIAIRVAVARDGLYTYHAGGGIVADSDPAREYAECLLKARPFLGALLDGSAAQRPAEGTARPAAR